MMTDRHENLLGYPVIARSKHYCKYQAIKFIKENYKIEYTLSLEDAVDDMVMVAKKWGEFSPLYVLTLYKNYYLFELYIVLCKKYNNERNIDII